jgi:hypothetical protein
MFHQIVTSSSSFKAGTIGSTEFHQVLQDVTNFPLKPFVLPFLKVNIPLLTREMATNAALADQTTIQFLRSHPNFLSESFNGEKLIHFQKRTERQMERWTDGQTDKWKYRQMERQTGRWTDGRKDGEWS